MAEKLLTVAEVASQLSLNTHTVYRLIRKGTLKATRIADMNALRIKQKDVNAIQQRRAVNRAPTQSPAASSQ